MSQKRHNAPEPAPHPRFHILDRIGSYLARWNTRASPSRRELHQLPALPLLTSTLKQHKGFKVATDL
jgi:hypothetical protein